LNLSLIINLVSGYLELFFERLESRHNSTCRRLIFIEGLSGLLLKRSTENA